VEEEVEEEGGGARGGRRFRFPGRLRLRRRRSLDRLRARVCRYNAMPPNRAWLDKVVEIYCVNARQRRNYVPARKKGRTARTAHEQRV